MSWRDYADIYTKAVHHALKTRGDNDSPLYTKFMTDAIRKHFKDELDKDIEIYIKEHLK